MSVDQLLIAQKEVKKAALQVIENAFNFVWNEIFGFVWDDERELKAKFAAALTLEIARREIQSDSPTQEKLVWASKRPLRCPGCQMPMSQWRDLMSHVENQECSYGVAMAIKFPMPPRVDTVTQLTLSYAGESEEQFDQLRQVIAKHNGDGVLRWSNQGRTNVACIFANIIDVMNFILELPGGVFVIDAKEPS